MDDFARRVTLNIRGCRFQTLEKTLSKFPDTLLGCAGKRQEYYDSVRDEYYFDRDKFAFDAILFYYQSKGRILRRPETVPPEVFDEELKFYQICHVGSSQEETPKELPKKAWQKKLWVFLEEPQSSRKATWLANVSMLVIVASVVVFCVETLFIPSDNNSNKTASSTSRQLQSTAFKVRPEIWFVLDTFITVWFSLEYMARLISAPRTLPFVFSTLGIIDLAAIVPYFISLGMGTNYTQFISFTALRIFRLLRVIRLLKLTRYVAALRILGQTIRSCQDQLTALMFLFMISIILSSSCIYFVERKLNPEQFSSIPAAFWWSIITMTTVGYGDMVPITPLGKLVGAVCAVFGVVVMLCLPTPVFISHFNDIYYRHTSTIRRARQRTAAAEESREEKPGAT